MKICYLASANSIHTFRWVIYFFRQRHEVSLISFTKPDFDYEGVKIFLIKKIIEAPGMFSQTINFFPILVQLWLLKKKIKADLFHALGSNYGWFAGFVGLRPLIFTIADPGIFSIPYQRALPFIYKLLNGYTFKRTDLFVCDGENTREAMIKFGVNPERIKIIRYGVDLEKFKPSLAGKELKKRFFQEENKIVISTKPLRPECDLETLVKAIPSVLKEVPEARFLIVGDGPEKEKLVSLAKKLVVDNKIVFTGEVPAKDIPSYFQMADVYVCTSLIETGIAASTAEAMVCSLPLVLSDSGDNKLIIKDGENGFIFPVKNSRILAKKIVNLLKDEELRKKFSLANRQWIEENNNYQKEMSKMEKIYQDIIR